MSKLATVDIGDDEPVTRKEHVYFIEGDSAVKIGYSTDMYKRLADLRTGSKEPMVLIDYAMAGREVERELHRILASERLSGEWFKTTDKTMDLIWLISDFLETFDDNDEDIDGRDTHVLTLEELADIQARPYWWRVD